MTAWSYSSLNQFLTCAKQYHEVRVLKNYKETSEHLLWGERVHKFMEQELNGTSSSPSEFEAYRGVVQRFLQTKGELKTEQQLAITNAFQPTGWFAPDVWCRGVLDACWIAEDVARVVDWKTGKRKPDSKQLLLFALLVFAHYPKVNRVNTAFVWLQTGKMDTAKFHRSEVTKLWQEILPEVRRLEYAHKTQTWIPKPSGLCRGYCPVRTCTFWDGKNESVVATQGAAA